MKKKAILILITTFLVSCAMPYVYTVRPGEGEYQTSRIYDRPFDEVWSAAMNVMQAYPIKTIEKESGIIVSEVIKLKKMPEYKLGLFQRGKEPEGTTVINTVAIDPMIASRYTGEKIPEGSMRCNIRVQEIDTTHTKVTINIISNIDYVTAPSPSSNPYAPPSSPAQKEFETASIGYNEAVFLWKIAKELGINEPEPELPEFPVKETENEN